MAVASSISSRIRSLLIGLAALLVVGAIPFVFRELHRVKEPAPLDRETMTRALALAREGVEHGAGLRAAPPDLSRIDGVLAGPIPGPVFVSVYGLGFSTRGEPPMGVWESGEGVAGRNLAEALVIASTEAGRLAKGQPETASKLGSSRIKIDLVRGYDEVLKPLWLDWEPYVHLVIDPGRDGLVAVQGRAKTWFLPSWSIERGIGPVRFLNLLRNRTKYKAKDVETEYARFRTVAFVEGTADEPGPLSIFRGNVLVPELSSATVQRSLELGGAYLARMIDQNGRYCYTYDAGSDRCDKDYNLLRHNGTTYSLFQIYQESPDPVTLAAAERASEWMRRQVRPVQGDPSRVFMLEGTKAKLGAIGLGLLALVEREKVVKDGKDRVLMEKMARFIKSQQHDNGYLVSFYQWDPKVKVPDENSIYYPGEALLGMVRMYKLDPQPWILEAARLSADYLALERWTWGGIELQVPVDAWLTQALAELYPLTKDEALKAYTYRLVGEMIRTQLRAEEGAPVDMAGGPIGGLELPSVTPAGSRNEAMTAAFRMAQAAGDTEEAAWIREASMRGAKFQLSQQFRPATSYFLRNPARAMGGFRSRPDRLDVRIDYVQHNATGLQTLLHILKEEGR